MRYDEFKTKVKTGDVLAWTHKGWGSWYDVQLQMVRFFTQSEYQHVGIAYVDKGEVFVLESVVGGIRKYPLTRDLPCFWIPVDISWTDAIEQIAFSKMGQGYSKLQAILSVVFKLKPGKDGKWECAEYVQFIMNAAGIPMDVKNTPSNVVGWLQENQGAPVYPIKL